MNYLFNVTNIGGCVDFVEKSASSSTQHAYFVVQYNNKSGAGLTYLGRVCTVVVRPPQFFST